jgi:hypothetical protein
MKYSVLAAILGILLTSLLAYVLIKLLIYMHMNRIETFIHWKLQQVSNEICEFVFRGYGATEPQQTLDFLEVCAGSHRITSAAAEFGLRATALDDTWLITLSLG